jgi:gentisate 1,2-dioxygenase
MNTLRKSFDSQRAAFADVSGASATDNNRYWAPVVITKAEIDTEIERLASLPAPANGRRESLIVHPMAPASAPGLAPGIQVKLSVLTPGEETAPFRHNATEVNFNIAGEGEVAIDGRTIRHERYDVWNHPSFTRYVHRNTGRTLQARLTYTNVPLLQNLNVYLPEDLATGEVDATAPARVEAPDPARKSPFGMIPIGDEGGMLMPYETLINPTPAVSRALHFPWRVVKAELDKLVALGKSYVGRRLYMMYNPLTTRFNGITPNFFATMTIRPAGNRRSAASACLRGDQLLLQGSRVQHRRGESLRMGRRRPDVVGTGLDRAQPLVVRRAGVRADGAGPAAQHLHGVAALAGGHEASGATAGFERRLRDEPRHGDRLITCAPARRTPAARCRSPCR